MTVSRECQAGNESRFRILRLHALACFLKCPKMLPIFNARRADRNSDNRTGRPQL